MIVRDIGDILNDCTDQQKSVILKVGVETIAKAITVSGSGHTSIDSHLYYINEDDPHLPNVIINTLGGRNKAREMLVESISTGPFKNFINILFEKINVPTSGG